MLRRGVLNPASNIWWVDATGREFDQDEDIAWLIGQVTVYRPEVIVLDTATDAVSDSHDPVAVRRMMALLGFLVSHTPCRAVIGLAQPRKTGQAGSDRGRSFDSLYGSRVWKSKASAVLWLEESRLTVWKQRGNYLRKRWGKSEGARYAHGALERLEVGPPTVAGPPVDESAARAALDAQAIEKVRERPGYYSKTSLAESLGGKRQQALDSVARLIEAGTFGEPSGTRGAKLALPPDPTF